MPAPSKFPIESFSKILEQHLLASIMYHLVAQRLKHLPAMWETWVRSLVQKDPLENEMATHSSVLAWRIPWTEEPGGLQSTGLQRVRHDWVTSLHSDKNCFICCFLLFFSCSVVSHPSVTSWTLACPASLSMGFFWARTLNGLPFPHPEDLPDPGTEQKFLLLL